MRGREEKGKLVPRFALQHLKDQLIKGSKLRLIKMIEQTSTTNLESFLIFDFNTLLQNDQTLL